MEIFIWDKCGDLPWKACFPSPCCFHKARNISEHAHCLTCSDLYWPLLAAKETYIGFLSHIFITKYEASSSMSKLLAYYSFFFILLFPIVQRFQSKYRGCPFSFLNKVSTKDAHPQLVIKSPETLKCLGMQNYRPTPVFGSWESMSQIRRTCYTLVQKGWGDRMMRHLSGSVYFVYEPSY